MTAGVVPSMPFSSSADMDRVPETSARIEPFDFSKVMVAADTPATSPIRGTSPPR